MQVTVETELKEGLTRYARAQLPREACGLLGARASLSTELRIYRFIPMTNRATQSDEFWMDPVEIARAQASFRGDGGRLAGTFHSHPSSPAAPSRADLETGWAELVHLILAIDRHGQAGTLTAWQYKAHNRQQLPLRQVHRLYDAQ